MPVRTRLSGAVLDPSALRELIPDCEAKGVPFAVPVHRDHVYFLTKQSKLPFPIIPPPLQNHGNVIVSLNALVKWLSEQVEKEGIDLFTGFPGTRGAARRDASDRCQNRRSRHREGRIEEE